jgi:hypothetical protein
MLLKVLVFAYAQGIRSSRNIDRLLESLHQQRTSQECNHYETVDSGRRQQEIESPHFSARI